MNNLKNLQQFKISKTELKFINGGVDVVEYCRTLDMIVRHNDLSDSALIAARLSAAKHCSGIL
ncbi:hypothetical protein U6A24_20570 [Aquimarina gracilis]|uniref:Uncharacterized protein n=1 Tax=Aquimarina gracilis TaxID=874422 RepID=A0ABU6A187_9FLAO|nr:hypothetical protein [Aquimarina gracilis]MEB3347884.1 hypothetical protein [Aquimarina gracilis]